MFAVLAATLPATSSRPVTERLMSPTAWTRMEQQARDDQRGDQADHERQGPDSVRAHLPTATFRRARAECRIRTPESLMRAIPELVGLAAHRLDALDRRASLRGDPPRERHDRDHDRCRHSDHDDPEREPHVPARGSRDHLHVTPPPLLCDARPARALESALREDSDDVSLVLRRAALIGLRSSPRAPPCPPTTALRAAGPRAPVRPRSPPSRCLPLPSAMPARSILPPSPCRHTPAAATAQSCATRPSRTRCPSSHAAGYGSR